jgi:uncharacterized protein involved in exopolysaccharide biosynthesis
MDTSKFDIRDSLEEYAAILKKQGSLVGEVLALQGRGYDVSSLEAKIQALDAKAAAVSSAIVQAFACK